MKTPEFLGMTLGDLFAEFDHCTKGFLHATGSSPLEWGAARDNGHRACYLSQCIVAEISSRKRRRDMPCDQACDLLSAFTTAARKFLASAAATDRAEAKDLERFTKNMELRVSDLNEMGHESEDLDKTVFCLDTTEEKVEQPNS